MQPCPAADHLEKGWSGFMAGVAQRWFMKSSRRSNDALLFPAFEVEWRQLNRRLVSAGFLSLFVVCP
jgi:hypothetical protein